MNRRSITLGVEQVAELMQHLSKTKGLLEELGIDFGAIPGPRRSSRPMGDLPEL
jgi:hypothetical protein